jgi:hypothetical protein
MIQEDLQGRAAELASFRGLIEDGNAGLLTVFVRRWRIIVSFISF